MSSLQNIFSLIFLSLFINCVHNEPRPTNIREMGNSNNSFAITPQKASTDSGNTVQNISSETESIKVQMHNGREQEMESPTKDLGLSKKVNNSSSVLTKSDDVKPIYDMQPDFNVEVPPQHDSNKSSVPKKGVDFPDMDPPPNITTSTDDNKISTNRKGANTLINSSINRTAFHKPIVTEADDGADTIDSADSSSKQTVININQIDPLLATKESNRSDYIVPIVAVILSVPLVAIVISIVYKRGADWWQHRNYKRMDFLIEGMYHQ